MRTVKTDQTGRVPRLTCLRCAHRSFCWLCRSAAHFYYCVAAIDPCEADPCLHGGTCSSVESDYFCSCGPGWAGRDCEHGKETLRDE